MPQAKPSPLCRHLAQKHGLTTIESQELVSAVVRGAQELLERGQIVRMHGLATFRMVRVSNRRAGRNFATGEALALQPRMVLRVKPSRFRTQAIEK